jgi:putative addiction module killer protein
LPVTIRTTIRFERWLRKLPDAVAKRRIAFRLQRLAFGHAGDAKALGGGLWELREHTGPGYRVYFVRRGEEVIVLLAGGTKQSQKRDIDAARRAILEEKDENERF